MARRTPTIISENPAMVRALAFASKVATTPYPVLILGETGSGKELVARGIHADSGLSGAFTPVNCAAIPEQLFEAELFGAERGAYTGLHSERKGLFRAADGGTLFLDEIAEMPLATQAKLLRVLQDGQVQPLGTSARHDVSVRIIAATHRDLTSMVEAGDFRMDLYFRISTASVRVPSLRERTEDIPSLIELAVEEAARVQGATVPVVDRSVIELARVYRWPGNVRELNHAVASAMLRAGGGRLMDGHFEDLVARSRQNPREPVAGIDSSSPDALTDLPLMEARARFEQAYMLKLMERSRGNLSRAARTAGVARSTLREKLRRHGLAVGSSSTRPAGPPQADMD